MQEVYEEISQRIAAESPDMVALLEDLSQKKRDKVIKKLSESDAESLYNIIEEENPLSGDSK
jgi:Mg/Co/Ni transporter MgtE